MASIRISKYSSLNFDNDWKRNFEKDESYSQKFANTDTIRVQYSVPANRTITIALNNSENDITEYVVPSLISTYTGEDGKVMNIFEFTLKDLETGRYALQFIQGGVIVNFTYFCVYDISDLENTVLLEYKHYRNEFDTSFVEDESQYSIFQFRVEGGFLPSEYAFLVDNEVFRDQRYGMTQLSALPYKKETLTIGNSYGIPVWAAEKVNLIFSVLKVTVNGKTYTRSENSTPQITVLASLYPLYSYKIELEPEVSYSYDFDLPNFKVLGTTSGDILTTIDNKAILV